MEQQESGNGTGMHSLNARQKFQLALWLKENANSLRVRRATVREAADSATEDLGFVVGPSSIVTAKEATGVCWKEGRLRPRQSDREWVKQQLKALARGVLGACLTLESLCEEMSQTSGKDICAKALHPYLMDFLASIKRQMGAPE